MTAISRLPGDGQPELPGLDLVKPFVEHTTDGKANTIELFDAVMTYSGEHAREGLRLIEVTKQFRGRTINVRVSPAVITRRNGTPVNILPGVRENLVEKALRKIAGEEIRNMLAKTGDKGEVEVWVHFTLYQLRKTLAEQGHEFKISQLVEALRVLRGTRLEISGELDNDYEAGRDSNVLQDLAWRKCKRGDEEGRSYTVAVKFHPFVTRSIVARSFRLIDFAKLMRPKNELARWIYLRLSHNYTQADEMDLWNATVNKEDRAGYHLTLSTILRETGFRYADMTRAMRAVRTALDVLREIDVLRGRDTLNNPFPGWLEFPQYGAKSGRGRPPLLDCRFVLFPSQSVIDDIIKANRNAQEMRRVK